MKKKDTTTIIFVNKDQNAKKPIQLPTSFVKHWKWYAFGLCSSFVLLLTAVLYLAFNSNTVREIKAELALELKQHKKELAKADTSIIREQYRSLNQKLSKLNAVIKSKGIKMSRIENIGGEDNANLLSTEETGALYENYLHKFIYYLDRIPVGYPHPGKITSKFGYRENPFTGSVVETHKGIDIKAVFGSIVNSTANGVVTFAGYKGGYGNLIILSHGNGMQTLYGHLSKILVKQGQTIGSGQIIGKVGSTGRSTGPHLHYEIHQNGRAINPKPFLTFE
jgi:murein DD-endopeptidase MepM/ murein hydrolase activator NlpD